MTSLAGLASPDALLPALKDPLVLALAVNLGHQHSRVRLASLQALHAMVQHGVPLALMQESVLPAVRPLAHDHAPAIRAVLFSCMAQWAGSQLPGSGAVDATDDGRAANQCRKFLPLLLPLLLLGVTDEVEAIRSDTYGQLEVLGARMASQVGGGALQCQPHGPVAVLHIDVCGRTCWAAGWCADSKQPVDHPQRMGGWFGPAIRPQLRARSPRAPAAATRPQQPQRPVEHLQHRQRCWGGVVATPHHNHLGTSCIPLLFSRRPRPASCPAPWRWTSCSRCRCPVTGTPSRLVHPRLLHAGWCSRSSPACCSRPCRSCVNGQVCGLLPHEQLPLVQLTCSGSWGWLSDFQLSS